MGLDDFILDGILHVCVKPNAKKTEVVGFDPERKAVVIRVAAVPDKDKANKELVRFLSKELGKKVMIKRGHHSRLKVLEIS